MATSTEANTEQRGNRWNHTPQDLSIEILSYLNLYESNHLAHCSHDWLKASRIERRRLVEVTYEMALKLSSHSITLSTINQSPLARLITHLPTHTPFIFNQQEVITNAITHFPNLLRMVIKFSRPEPTSFVCSSSEWTSTPPPPTLQPFQLPPRVTTLTLEPNSYMNSIACEQQQIYLNSLMTASQLHTIELNKLDTKLDLTVLTQLPCLTNLSIQPRFNRTSGPTPIPDLVLPILRSLKQLVSLRLGWRILPDQWSQFHFPQLQHISHQSCAGVSCSTDLIPLLGTVMVKSIRHLRLHLDVGADFTQLMQLIRLTQLEVLEISVHSLRSITEPEMRDLQAALNQLTTLTSFKIHGLDLVGKGYNINLCKILSASIHLSSLELSSNTTSDLSFLHTPLVHTRLVELKLKGEFTVSDKLDGLLGCHCLRRLEIISWSLTALECWCKPFKMKLATRRILPTLDSLLIIIENDDGEQEYEKLVWDRWTGSKTHPSFRPYQPLAATVAAAAPKATPHTAVVRL